MKKDLAQIEFYFPEGKFQSTEKLIDSTISLMKESGSIDYAGFPDNNLLIKGLVDGAGNNKNKLKQYKAITKKQKENIEKIIQEVINKCNRILPIPIKNFIFVHPFFPDNNDKELGGVMGSAAYICVFHLFIDLNNYTKESLEQTIAHELNHTIYYYCHQENMSAYNLLENLILEGLAENFRESVLGGDAAPWSIALSKKEAFETLSQISSDLLYSIDRKFISKVLYGNNSEYKRWAGYSAGYWLVKEFITQNKNITWDKLMRIDAKEFIRVIKNKKEI